MGIEIEDPMREAFVCDTLFETKKRHRQVHADWHEDWIPWTHESLTVALLPEKKNVNQ